MVRAETEDDVKRTLAVASLLLALCFPQARAQKKIVSARAGLVTSTEGEVLYHCHEKGEGVERLQRGVQLHDSDLVFTAEGGRVTWSLNPDSYMTVSADSVVRVHDGALDHMHFDVERGEVMVVVRSLGGGAALAVHAPPAVLAVRKPGRYLFRVAEGGETEAAVERGELRYEEKGKTISVKKGRKVTFQKAGKITEHGT